jgi:hypothetical protein
MKQKVRYDVRKENNIEVKLMGNVVSAKLGRRE